MNLSTDKRLALRKAALLDGFEVRLLATAGGSPKPFCVAVVTTNRQKRYAAGHGEYFGTRHEADGCFDGIVAMKDEIEALRNERQPVAVKVEDAIRRELERWDGVAGLPKLASQIAPHVRRRVMAVLARSDKAQQQTAPAHYCSCCERQFLSAKGLSNHRRSAWHKSRAARAARSRE